MRDLLAGKIESGDLYINLARHHLSVDEWGLALKAVERGLSKGSLSEEEEAITLLEDIGQRLGLKHRLSTWQK